MRKKSTKPTIKDIAAMCNVSTQTVSRVINKRHDVAPETRELVEKAIAEMNYHPSMLARSLVKQRSNTIGVILAGLNFLGVSQTLNGIAGECENNGYTLVVKELPTFDTPNFLPVIESLISHQVEGIIFAAPELNDNVTKAQAQLPPSCPPNIFLKCHPNPAFTTISIDNRGGAYNAVKYLTSIGRKQIALITGPLEWLESRQRKVGWEEALRDSGIDPLSCNWREGQWTSSSGEAAISDLYAIFPGMDAVFVSNDQMALGVLHYAAQHGIRVPEELAVIGFDDIAEAAFFSPSLSSTTHPLRELGSLAVKNLMDQIEGKRTSKSHYEIVLPTQLILRGSTPRREHIAHR